MRKKNSGNKVSCNRGFTLAEILVALAISGIVLTTVAFLFQTQHGTYSDQNQVAEMQQNLRVAMYSMQRELRLIGLDPTNSGLFGITDIKTRDVAGAAVNMAASPPAAYSAITFTADFGDGAGGNPNGVLNVGAAGPPVISGETITYRMFDFIATDGNLDLARIEDGAAINTDDDLLVENIEMIGLAFAFDTDNDGLPETYNVGGVPTIIWAVDTNNDNTLDANLDTDADGIISAADVSPAGMASGYGLIDGTALAAAVPLNQIYAVRIWLLARTNSPEQGFLDQDTYAVGRQLINPSAIATEQDNGGYKRLLLDTSVLIRNMAL